ncbi:hypothetical protein BDV96DRAFT_645934 [Lophiotrema nucula]|uniref:Uncharacterized protein n=1 Tax=Lophiotrema nucula TaxID=690887 RepID=A0A6A5Z8J1_9PLEO|nr:hypothetical protein BDV96DRAFT_645934 [Lophiotrema nucula]
MLLPPLPDELTLDILSYIEAFAPKTRQQTLAALCLTNRALSKALQAHLYRHIDVAFADGYSLDPRSCSPSPALFNLLRTLIKYPSLGERVQEARIRANVTASGPGWERPYSDLPIKNVLKRNNVPDRVADYIFSFPHYPQQGLHESAVCTLLLLLPNIETLVISTDFQTGYLSGLVGICAHVPQPVLRKLHHLEIHDAAPALLGGDTSFLLVHSRPAAPLQSLTIDLGEIMNDRDGRTLLDSSTSGWASRDGVKLIKVPRLRLRGSGRLVLVPSFIRLFQALTRFEMIITNAKTLTYITPTLSLHANTLEHLSLVLLGKPTGSEPPISSLGFLERLKSLHLSKSVLFGTQSQLKDAFDLAGIPYNDQETGPQTVFSLRTLLPETLEELTLDITGVSTQPAVSKVAHVLDPAPLSSCIQVPEPSAYEGLRSAQIICYVSPLLPVTQDIFSKCYPAFHIWKTLSCAGLSSELVEDQVRAWANERLRETWSGNEFEQIMELHEKDLGTSCFSKLESFEL